MNKKISIILLITFFIFISIFLIVNLSHRSQKINLTFWGYNISPQIIQPFIDAFEKQNPNIKISYYQKDINDYYNNLIDAFSNKNAPDIFLIYGSWLPLFDNHLYPLNLNKDSQINQRFIENNYPPIIKQELITDKYLRGIPLSIDTLVLYYNPTIFNESNISKPPRSWQDLLSLIAKLKRVNKEGQITRAAIALGTPNVNWQSDILANLMLQVGSDISDPSQKIFTFLNIPPNSPINIPPAVFAFSSYTQFANPKSQFYNWNQNLSDSSLKAFCEGKTAMILAYAQDKKFIDAYCPDLSYKIYPFPNINPTIFYGRTTNLVVNNESKYPDLAWKFLKFLATKEMSELYLKLNNVPPARLDLIQTSLSDPFLNIFASQALLSKSWYQFNYQIINEAFNKAVIEIINNQSINNILSVLSNLAEYLQQQWRNQN
ncbi:MAG: ABC transporter substrate-binding protein [Minisyncoccia bacterium]